MIEFQLQLKQTPDQDWETYLPWSEDPSASLEIMKECLAFILMLNQQAGKSIDEGVKFFTSVTRLMRRIDGVEKIVSIDLNLVGNQEEFDEKVKNSQLGIGLIFRKEDKTQTLH